MWNNIGILPRKAQLYLTKLLFRGFVEKGSFEKIWIEDHSPVLMNIKERLERERPFKDLRIGVCLPATWETFMLLTALKSGRASISFVPMFPAPEVFTQLLKETNIEIKKGSRGIVMKSDFLYDCDATFGKTIVQEEADVKGIVEQTTSGIAKYKEYSDKGLLKQPVFDLNSSNIKRLRENRSAVGLGLIGALLNLHLFLPGKRVLVVGFGDVGSGCAYHLRTIGCMVSVYDCDPKKLLEARCLGYQTGSLKDLLPSADIIVTATGASTPALDWSELNFLKKGAMLVNMGGIGWSRENFVGRNIRRVGGGILKIYLDDETYIYELAKGLPANLILGYGTDIETMDKIFSLGILTMEYLVENYRSLPKEVLPIPCDLELQIL